MPNSELLAPLLAEINENQIALKPAIMEISRGLERHGASEGADSVRNALTAFDHNDVFIRYALAILTTPD
jgi:hypothetical protein